MYVRLNSKHVNLSIIIAYAPTDTSEGEEKDEFYDALQSILKDVPRHDVLLVLGDFNARVGTNNHDEERAMGKHGIGLNLTDNGERLIDIC